MLRRLLFIVLALVLGRPQFTSAQWQQAAGPDGGPITRLAANPSNGDIFALANGMPYRSNNAGSTWTPLYPGLDGRFLGSAIASGGADTYLTGVAGGNVPFYHSASYGTTWIATASTGLPQFFFPDAIAVSGANVVCASSLSSGIYVSPDHGENWTAATGLPDNVEIGFFASRGTYLYAGSALGSAVKGIYRSADDGATWTATNATFLSGALAYLTCLTANANAIFAGTGLTGTYRCTDTGSIWTKINPDATSDFNSAMVATSSNLYVCLNAGRIDRSDQNGDNWTHVNTGLPAAATNESIPALTATGTTIIAGTPKVGIYLTTNQGALWTQSNLGLHASKINGLLTAGSKLYAASATNGFFRSSDHGGSWSVINTGIVQNGDWFGFSTVSTGLLGGAGLAHLYRSSNEGDTWTTSNTNLGLTGVDCFVRGGADTVYAAGLAGVSFSTNGGSNWTFQTAGSSVGETFLDMLKDGPFMMMGGDVGGCARSLDNGQTWGASYLGLPSNGSNPAFAKLDTVWFVANTNQGVYRSYDHGAHWAKANTGISGAPWCLYALGPDLYAGTSGGVWKSVNRGTSWTSFNSGLPDSLFVNKLTADSLYLYAGTAKLSVWRYPLSPSCCTGTTGDVNIDGSVSLVDLSALVSYLTGGGYVLPCQGEANINATGGVDIVDLSSLISYLAGGGYTLPLCP